MRLKPVLILMMCLSLTLAKGVFAEQTTATGAKSGWYIAAPESESRPSLAIKLQQRGKVFAVSGVLGFPANTKGQFPIGGTYYPSTKKLAATWQQPDGKKKVKLPIDGKYDPAKDAFDVTVLWISPGGPGRWKFHCKRSGGSSKETDLTGTWKVAGEGWTLRLTQKDDIVSGNYSGGGASGSIATKLIDNTLVGSYTHREGNTSYRGTIRATVTDENTITGVWTESKSGMSQTITATRT
jgi:hypothetical protein